MSLFLFYFFKKLSSGLSRDIQQYCFFEHSVNPEGALTPDYFIISTINYLVGARNVFSLAFILIFFFRSASARPETERS